MPLEDAAEAQTDATGTAGDEGNLAAHIGERRLVDRGSGHVLAPL